MNTQTQEALKMAIEALNVADAIVIEYSGVELEKIPPAINACKEALKQPLTRDWKETIDERIAKDDKFKEALAQPTPKNCTPLDEYIAEMEKDPEIKQLLNIAREDVKKWSTQPAQEPECSNHPVQQESVAIVMEDSYGYGASLYKRLPLGTPLYTHPAPSWQGLSDDEIVKAFNIVDWMNEPIVEFARAIEQALKEKNA